MYDEEELIAEATDCHYAEEGALQLARNSERVFHQLQLVLLQNNYRGLLYGWENETDGTRSWAYLGGVEDTDEYCERCERTEKRGELEIPPVDFPAEAA